MSARAAIGTSRSSLNIRQSIDPNIQPFTQRGGRLLMYHGWADHLVSPGASVNYYNSVVKALGLPSKVAESVRLFMVPGMSHCRGGDGSNSFDMVSALERWVEEGVAPDRIVASHLFDGKVDRTRPLCPYPQVAVYAGRGTTDDEATSSARCADATQNRPTAS